MGTIIVLLGEAELVAHGGTAGEWWSWDSNLLVCLRPLGKVWVQGEAEPDEHSTVVVRALLGSSDVNSR